MRGDLSIGAQLSANVAVELTAHTSAVPRAAYSYETCGGGDAGPVRSSEANKQPGPVPYKKFKNVRPGDMVVL